jgi:hypothetical protein
MHPLSVGVLVGLFLSASVLLCGTTIVQPANGAQPPSVETRAKENKSDPPPAATEKNSAKSQEDKLSPEQERERQKALDALGRVYALKPDEVVKCFSKPSPPERAAYLDAFLPKIPHASQVLEGYIWIIFTWNDRLKYKGATHHSNPRDSGKRVLDVITGLIDCNQQEVEGDEKTVTSGIAADFVVREQSPQEKVFEALDRILKEKFNMPVKITIKEEEREVFVLKGKCKLTPAAAKRIEVYGQELHDPDYGRAISGSFQAMLGDIGDFFIKRRIVAEVEAAPRQVSWHFNERPTFTKEQWAADTDPDSVMKHLGEATGLTVTKEKRRVRIVLVENAK